MNYVATVVYLVSQLIICKACNKDRKSTSIQTKYNLILELNVLRNVTLYKDTSCIYQRVIVRLPYGNTYSFVTLQAHTQYKSVAVSFTETPLYGHTSISSNAGILNMLNGGEMSITGYIGNNDTPPVFTSLLAVPSTRLAPIPGGCCLTCSMEIDPNIKVSFAYGKASIFFHRASQYYDPSFEKPLCDNSNTPGTYKLIYTVYYYYINDFSTGSLFSALYKMSTPEKIRTYGISLSKIEGSRSLTLTFQPMKGQGVVFNVIVYDPTSKVSSAYVPVSTYHCHFKGINADCYTKKDITAIVYYSLCFVIGAVLSLAGFKLLRLLLFVSGFLLYWFIIYVILYRRFIDVIDDLNSDATARDLTVISSICAIMGGGMTLFFYAFDKLILICLLTVGSTLAMFITSIIFYTPLGHISFWDGDDKFLFAFVCISVCFITFFFFLPKFLCLFSSSMMGSYAMILLPNYFLHGSMQYIALVAVLRISSSMDYFLERPYKHIDYILSGVWVAVFIIGFAVQCKTSRNENLDTSGIYITQNTLQRLREMFGLNRSESESLDSSQTNGRRRRTRSIDVLTTNERTPLISNHDQQHSGNMYLSNNNQRTGNNLSTFNQPIIHRDVPGATAPVAPAAPPFIPDFPPPPYSAVPLEGEHTVHPI